MSSGKTSIIITGSNHSAIRPLQRVTVSQSFLRKVFVHFPLLKDRPDYRALFWHLLFGGWHDQDTHRLLLSAEVISSIEGRSAQNTRAGAYLEKFRTEVLVPNGCDMLWSGWYLKKCRQLRRLNLGSFQAILLQEQRGDWDLDGRVYLDGSRFNPKRQRWPAPGF